MTKAIFAATVLLFLGIFQLTSAQQPYAGVVQSIDIQDYQGKKFTFTALTKYKSSNQMIGFAAYYDDQGRFLANHLGDGPAPMEGREWQMLTLSGKINKKAAKLLVGVLCQGKGAFSLDDMTLSIKGQPNDSLLLVNGNLEQHEVGVSAFISLNKDNSISITPSPLKKDNHILKLITNEESTAIGSNKNAGKRVNANGVALYYETYGKGDPLLLLHGADMSIASFNRIIPILAKHYKVIALDTRGHGQSSEDGKKLTYELYAEDVNAFLDELGLEAVNVLGWSDGGNTGLILAMNHPDKVKSLAAMAAVLYNDKSSVDPQVNKILSKQIKALENGALTDREAFSLRVKKSLLTEPNISPSSLSKIT